MVEYKKLPKYILGQDFTFSSEKFNLLFRKSKNLNGFCLFYSPSHCYRMFAINFFYTFLEYESSQIYIFWHLVYYFDSL